MLKAIAARGDATIVRYSRLVALCDRLDCVIWHALGDHFHDIGIQSAATVAVFEQHQVLLGVHGMRSRQGRRIGISSSGPVGMTRVARRYAQSRHAVACNALAVAHR